MFRIGVVGMNPGNGHPYSFSAVFNDFDNDALQKECEFALIKEYLPAHHRHQEFIPDARITAVYAPEAGAAARIARVANIPEVCSSVAELVEKSDAILFTRDDIDRHWEMTGELFKSGKPLFIDKVLAHTPEDLRKFVSVIPENYPLMVASSFPWSPLVQQAKKVLSGSRVFFVNGVTSCVWVRYAPHLLWTLFELFGNEVVSVQNSGNDDGDIVTIQFANKVAAVCEIFNGVGLPLGLTIHRQGEEPLALPYTDEGLEAYFLSIAGMMQDFAAMIRSSIPPVPLKDIILLNRVVLAGIASKNEGGRKIFMSDFMSDIQR